MSLGRMLVKVVAGVIIFSGSWVGNGIIEGAEKSKYTSEDPPQKRVPGAIGKKNAFADGTVVGTIEAKGRRWIEVLSVGGKTAKYIPEGEGAASKDAGGTAKKIVKQIADVNVGDLVAVRWYVNDHLRIMSIKRLKAAKDIDDDDAPDKNTKAEDAGDDKVKDDGKKVALKEDDKNERLRIEAGKPRYVSKGKNAAWKERGRLVGLAKNGPGFTFSALSSSGKVVKEGESEKLEGGKRAYELWLKPGTYTLRIKAKNCKTFESTKMKVKAGYDLRMDLEFED